MSASVELMRDRLCSLQDRLHSLGGTAVVAGAALVAGTVVHDPYRLRAALAACGIMLLAAIGLRAPRPLLLCLIVWLTALGFVRRVLSGFSSGGAADPLLLIGPACVIVLAVAAYERGAFARHTPLARVVIVYTMLVVVSALNPLQGNLVAGVTGLIFFVPLAAFWIGRALCDDRTMTVILRLVAVLAVPAAAYGLYQAFVGFPSWDARWIQSVAFASLNVGGTIRPFSTFSSGAEFGTYLAIGVVTWLAMSRMKLALVTAPAVALLLVAAFYQSSRGVVVGLVVTLTVMVGAKKVLPIWVTFLVGALFIASIPAIAQALIPDTYGAGSTSALVQHQVEGLANPLDPESSTAVAHLNLLVNGLEEAFVNPLGHGIGAVTIAGKKFGGLSYGTETDPSNAAVALGLPGLVAYLALLVLAYSRVYRVAVTRRDGLGIAALGVVTVTLLQWLNGGQYAVAILPWLIFGWADRHGELARIERHPGPAAEATP